MYGRLETAHVFPHCEYVSPCREESGHNKRELMELAAAAENAHGRYKESDGSATVRIGGDLRRTRYD